MIFTGHGLGFGHTSYGEPFITTNLVDPMATLTPRADYSKRIQLVSQSGNNNNEKFRVCYHIFWQLVPRLHAALRLK